MISRRSFLMGLSVLIVPIQSLRDAYLCDKVLSAHSYAVRYVMIKRYKLYESRHKKFLKKACMTSDDFRLCIKPSTGESSFWNKNGKLPSGWRWF